MNTTVTNQPTPAEIRAFLQAEYHGLLGYAYRRLREVQVYSIVPERLVLEAVSEVLRQHPEHLLTPGYLVRVMAYMTYDLAHQERAFVPLESEFAERLTESHLALNNPEMNLHQFAEFVQDEDSLRRLWRYMGECLLKQKDSPTFQNLILPKEHVEQLLSAPRETGVQVALTPRTVSSYLHWVRKTIFPCVKSKFLRKG